MKSILEELYYGDVRPAERRNCRTELYEQCSEACDRLYGSLEEGQKKLFRRFEDCESARNSHENCRAFVQGFSLALRLMVESLAAE